MVAAALFVRLGAKPGKEAEGESFLKSGLPIVQAEPGTTAWFGTCLEPSNHKITGEHLILPPLLACLLDIFS